MIKHIPWLTVLFLFCLLVVAKRSEATERHDHQTVTNVTVNKKDKSWQFPVLVIGIAAGACWIYCGEQPKDEPPPNPGPALKITPDNLSDKQD